MLVLPGPSSDLVAIGLALIAAAAWAGYILINQVADRRFPGLQTPAVAGLVPAIAYLPGIVVLGIAIVVVTNVVVTWRPRHR